MLTSKTKNNTDDGKWDKNFSNYQSMIRERKGIFCIGLAESKQSDREWGGGRDRDEKGMILNITE